jgi:restriction endonuclease S subunit
MYFNKNAQGSSIKMIDLEILNSLEVEIPTLVIQKNIVELHELFVLERKLTERLTQLKEKFYTHILMKKIKGVLNHE